jgi:hypothetical protein
MSIFRPAFQLTSGLRFWLIFRLSFPVHVQLAPSANVPTLPSNLTSDSHRLLCSPGAAFWFICDRRRLSTFRPCLRTQHPTLIVRCIPSAAFLMTCDLRRRSTFQPACGSNLQRFVCCAHSAMPSGLPATRAARSTFQPSLWTQPTTHRLPCSRVVRSS